MENLRYDRKALYRGSVDKLRTGTYVVSYINRAACRGCALRERCTKKTYRSLKRFENESTMERMANRLAAKLGVMARQTSPTHALHMCGINRP